MTVATSRMITRKFWNCSSSRCHHGVSGALFNWFSPYCSRRRCASARLKPRAASEPSAETTASAGSRCGCFAILPAGAASACAGGCAKFGVSTVVGFWCRFMMQSSYRASRSQSRPRRRTTAAGRSLPGGGGSGARMARQRVARCKTARPSGLLRLISSPTSQLGELPEGPGLVVDLLYLAIVSGPKSSRICSGPVSIPAAKPMKASAPATSQIVTSFE